MSRLCLSLVQPGVLFFTVTSFAALGISAAACNKASDSQGAVVKALASKGRGASYKLEEILILPETRTWTDHEHWEGSPPTTKKSEQRQLEDVPSMTAKCEGTPFVIGTEQTSAGGGNTFGTKGYYCKDDKGFAHFASDNRTLGPTFYPMRYELLADARVGQVWSSASDEGGETDRFCVAVEAERCDNGLTTVCINERKSSLLRVEQHYCKGLGWVGYEAMKVAEGAAKMQAWSSDLVVDGKEVEGSAKPPAFPAIKMVEEELDAIKRALK